MVPLPPNKIYLFNSVNLREMFALRRSVLILRAWAIRINSVPAAATPCIDICNYVQCKPLAILQYTYLPKGFYQCLSFFKNRKPLASEDKAYITYVDIQLVYKTDRIYTSS